MQKLNSVNSNAELQQRLADHGGSGDTARENGTKHIPSPAEPVDTVQCSSRKMLVGLDVLCLLVGKRNNAGLELAGKFVLGNSAVSMETSSSPEKSETAFSFQMA
ncbi:unnamed protein product [Leuciscus chuanchicus]